MRSLRQTVTELMVRVHKISPELAECFVLTMSISEMKRRVQMYQSLGFIEAGVESSAAGPTQRAGNAVSTRFLRPATMTAGGRHSTLILRR